jgi:hypothetical protein
MMFYDAMGGAAYASTPNRYKGFIDMSRLLAGNDAILLARGPATQLTPESPPSGMGASMSSAWRMTGAEPRSMSGIKQFVPLSDKDKNWTYYRFIIPLQEPIADAPTSDRPEADPEPLLGPQPFGS